MRLIDADALADALFEKRKNYPQWVADTIGGMPTIDVDVLLKEQEGTGCWEWITEDKYRCSECHNTTYVDECMEEPQYLFCPYCGHKMTFVGRN